MSQSVLIWDQLYIQNYMWLNKSVDTTQRDYITDDRFEKYKQ